MYAVIFKAEIASIDEAYRDMSSRLRQIAIDDYNCLDFVSATQGNIEIAISYWTTLEHINAWKQNAEHRMAQAMGQSKWYRSYEVQVTKIMRNYKQPMPESERCSAKLKN